MSEGDLEKFNLILQKKYQAIKQKEPRWEEMFLEDARLILVAYGTMARICKGVVKRLRQQGKKIGLIRPITLWPFPESQIAQILKSRLHRKRSPPAFLVVEMSYGQMLEDVRLAVNGKARVEFLGRGGGGIPTEEEIIKSSLSLLRS